MSLAVTVSKKWSESQSVHVVGTMAFSSSYATGGESFDFATITGSTRQPYSVDIRGKSGHVYLYDDTAKKVMVFCNTAGGANGVLGEHTAASYASTVTNDTVRFHAISPKFG